MSSLVIFVLGALTLIILVVIGFVAGLAYLRNKKPRSEKLERGREQSTTKPVTDSPKKSGTGVLELIKGKISLGSKVFWNIATIIAIIALFLYLGTESKVDPADIGNQTWNHWIQILMVWGAAAFLIWLNADEKKAGSLQTKVFWVVVILLVALPIWSWFTTLSFSFDSPKESKVHQIQIPPLGDSVQVKVAPGEHVEWKSADGTKTEMHCILMKPDGSTFEDGTCGSSIVRTYMRNLSNWPQIVTYEIKKG